jgi:ATP-dependent Zn protease
MGGRVAEILFLGEENQTSGCMSDMQKATDIAYSIINSGLADD